jgi:hypothetical protein
MKALEEKRPDPLCPNGHVMNFEPMNTIEDIGPLFKKLEDNNRLRPGTLLRGNHSCPGGCGRSSADFSFGWHTCTHRPYNECNYLTRCNTCFIKEIAEP